AAPVLEVAVLTGVGIEQRTQAVTRSGGGGRWHPGIAEEAVADGEVQTPARRQVGRGLGKGVVVVLAYRGGASGQGFAGFCRREPELLIAGNQDQGQKGQQAALERRHRGTIRVSGKTGRQGYQAGVI